MPLLGSICPTSAGCPRCLCSLPTFSNTFLYRRVSQVKNGESQHRRLTQPPTFHFLRHNRKDSEYLDHNINIYVRHCRSRCNAGVKLKPLEISFYAVEEVDKFVSASVGIFSRLRRGIKIVPARERRKRRTMRSAPIPVKIMFTGGNS